MNDKLRGLEFDMVVLDELSDMNKEMQKMMDNITKQLDADVWGTFNWGTKTGRVPERYCTYCKFPKLSHEAYSNTYSDGHPFFNDNLEFLEWKCKKRGI